MSNTASVELVNGREFRKALRAAELDMVELKAANRAAATIVANTARTTAPARTGRLRASIRPNNAAARARVTSRLVYAPVVHWGWPARGIPANRFLERAAEMSEPVWRAGYEADLQRIVNNLNNKTRTP